MTLNNDRSLYRCYCPLLTALVAVVVAPTRLLLSASRATAANGVPLAAPAFSNEWPRVVAARRPPPAARAHCAQVTLPRPLLTGGPALFRRPARSGGGIVIAFKIYIDVALVRSTEPTHKAPSLRRRGVVLVLSVRRTTAPYPPASWGDCSLSVLTPVHS